MANTITKLTANGNYYLSGGLDEVSGTYSTNGLICHWPTYSPSFVAGSQWIDIVNGNNLYIPTSNIYNPAYGTTYSNAVYTTNNLFFGTGSTAYNVDIPQLAGATSCTIEGVIKIQAFSGGMVAAFAQYDIYTGGGGLGYNTANSDNYGITATQVTNLGITGKYAHYVFVLNTFPSGTGTYANNQIWINGVQQTLTQNQSLCATSGRGFNNYNGVSLPGGQFPENYCFTINTWPNQFGGYTMNNGFGGLRMYNRTLTPAEIVQNYNVAASNPAFGLTPISAPPQSSLTINSTTQNTATFLANSIDETTYNPSSSIVPNFVRSSTDFTQTNVGNSTTTKPWNIGVPTWSITPTTATQDPFGGYTAFHINPTDTTTSFHAIYQNNGGLLNLSQLTAGTNITWSFYAKAAELNGVRLDVYDTVTTDDIYFNLNTGANYGFNAGLNGGSIYIGNGWYRLWGTRTLLASASINFAVGILVGPAGIGNWTADGVSGIYVCAPQLEIGTYPTKYVPTNLTGTVRNFLSRIDANGTSQLTGSYDEYTRGFNIIQNGLIYYMDPSKPESWNGSAVINDITNTYTPGSLNGGFTYNTSGGGSITLDGLTGYANTGILGNTSPFQTTSAFTMSVWCKFTGPARGSGGTSTLFGAFNFQGFGIAWQAPPNSYVNTLYGGVRVNTGTEFLTLTNNPAHFQLNQWYNYVLSYSSSNLANTNFLYINGSTLAPSGTQYATNLPYNTNMNGIYISLGNVLQESGGQAGYFPGQIGQALIYNRALSAAEVLQNYNEMKSQYTI